MPGDERIVDVAETGAYISLSLGRLVIRREGEPDAVVPLRDLAALILTHQQVVSTKAALAGVMQHGGAVIVCDDAMQPCGMMLPVVANSEQTRRMLAQAQAKLPLRKRLWRQLVVAKIRAQAAVLRRRRGDDLGLEAIAAQVRTGDVTNREAMAAQRYWPALFNNPDFRRRRDAPDQNRMLNYGYAALRAAVGRALCAAGLHPSLGVHHRDRTNPWCLADDLMEPYRPLIDEETAEIVASIGGDIALDGEVKAQIVGALHSRIEHEGESRTVMDWIGRSASSMAQAFLGERRQLLLPEGLWR